jgi:hypothetical protein
MVVKEMQAVHVVKKADAELETLAIVTQTTGLRMSDARKFF